MQTNLHHIVVYLCRVLNQRDLQHSSRHTTQCRPLAFLARPRLSLMRRQLWCDPSCQNSRKSLYFSLLGFFLHDTSFTLTISPGFGISHNLFAINIDIRMGEDD